MKYRIKSGKIVYELFEPKGKNLKKGVIVISGLPNQPRNEDFGDTLAEQGFYVLQPRYIGSWESDGKFSLTNCIKTVLEAERLFLQGKAKECWGNKKIEWSIEKVYILSSSFGSTIVLSALPKLKSERIICLAPLTDLKKHNSDKNLKEEDLTHLGGFLKRGFANAFRGLDEKDWKEFIKGDSEANPMNYIKEIRNKKILLLHGDADDVVNISRTEDYYNKIKKDNEVEMKRFPGIGHGKELKKGSFKEVVKWIRSN